MSFSLNTKREISKIINKRHCIIAELAAIINSCSIVKTNKLSLKIVSENEFIVQKFCKLINTIFEENIKIASDNGKTYKIIINDEYFLKKVFNTIEQSINNNRVYNSVIVNTICCKRAYIRGVFLCSGYISEPNKNYHLEIVCQNEKQAESLKNLINFFDIDAKVIEKKDNFLVYIKEAEQIVEFLNIIEAHQSLLELENIRVLKDVRNNVNRIVNCETANLNKIVSASVKQKENIEYIKNTVGLDYLPKPLREVAILRLENPDISLQELSQMTEPTITKSGVNHRLKKINIIAETIRGRK